MAHQLIRKPGTLFSIPVFLAPAFSANSRCAESARSFSSSSVAHDQVPRGNRDKSKNRGVSAIRRTGPRHRLSVQLLGPLPKPVSDPTEARAAFEVNPDHGLWGFFNENKEALLPSSEEDSHGRAWSRQELSKKDWSDLHKLYWVCIREMNVVRTRNNERKRLRVGYGQSEGEGRMQVLKKTMHRIRLVLLERHRAQFDARLLLGERYLFEIFPELLEEHMPQEALESEQLDADETGTLSLSEEMPVAGSGAPHNQPEPRDGLKPEGRGQRVQATE